MTTTNAASRQGYLAALEGSVAGAAVGAVAAVLAAAGLGTGLGVAENAAVDLRLFAGLVLFSAALGCAAALQAAKLRGAYSTALLLLGLAALFGVVLSVWQPDPGTLWALRAALLVTLALLSLVARGLYLSVAAHFSRGSTRPRATKA